MTELLEKIDHVWQLHFEGQSELPLAEVKQTLDEVGVKLPNHKVREICNELKTKGEARGESLSRAGFEKLCQNLTAGDIAKTFRTSKRHDKDAEKIQGQMGASHMVLNEEQAAFADWINTNLGQDIDVNHLMQLSESGADMYEKMDDGILLCKMINLAVPDTIDERVINKGDKISIFKRHENLTLAINSAKAIGCVVIGIDSHTLNSVQGKKWLVLGLIWQLIKMYLFKEITLHHVPGLIHLLLDGEDPSDLMKLSPEQLLIRWVNYQLKKAGSHRRMANFKDDIKDSEIYTELLHQIAPHHAGVHKGAMDQQDFELRAETMLEQADKIESRQFVTAKDVVNGRERLNMAFVANLFNNHPALDPPPKEMEEIAVEVVIEEPREEKMYRNWMNSLGVKPRVNYLYSDLYDGIVIFQLMDFIKPGIVNWKIVKTPEQQSKIKAKRFQEILQNCNYAVELGKKLHFVLVGIGGSDIMEGNKTLTLALVWQLMRAYTLSLLSQLNHDGTPIVESEIISWANKRLEEGGRQIKVKHFQDKTNKTALPILHLLDVMKPEVVSWDHVLGADGAALSEAQCLENSKYAITMARKIGAPVYALPEDISEVKHKMLMTVYASLMLADLH